MRVLAAAAMLLVAAAVTPPVVRAVQPVQPAPVQPTPVRAGTGGWTGPDNPVVI
jgi:hypothetical protein